MRHTLEILRGGRRVVDFQRSNLHVVSCSVPVRRRISRYEALSRGLPPDRVAP